MILPHVSSLSTQIYPGGIWGIGSNPVNCSFLLIILALLTFPVIVSSVPVVHACCCLSLYINILSHGLFVKAISSRNIDGITLWLFNIAMENHNF